jgi:hypothetical protein
VYIPALSVPLPRRRKIRMHLCGVFAGDPGKFFSICQYSCTIPCTPLIKSYWLDFHDVTHQRGTTIQGCVDVQHSLHLIARLRL